MEGTVKVMRIDDADIAIEYLTSYERAYSFFINTVLVYFKSVSLLYWFKDRNLYLQLEAES